MADDWHKLAQKLAKPRSEIKQTERWLLDLQRNMQHTSEYTEGEIEDAEKAMILEFIRDNLDHGKDIETILESISIDLHRA